MIYLKKELQHIGKQKSRIIVLIGLGFFVLVALALLISSCDEPQKNNPIDITFDVFPSEFLGIVKDKPVYITSIGQAIDIEDFLIEVDYLNLFEYTHDNMLQPEDVPAGAVVMAIVGCSIKGLTSAHLTLEEEMARSQAFMTKTKNKEITFIAWHIGGMARRGSTSDQIIETVFSGASLDLFLTYGDSDKFLTNIVVENDVPCYQIDYVGNIGLVLKLLAGEVNNGQ